MGDYSCPKKKQAQPAVGDYTVAEWILKKKRSFFAFFYHFCFEVSFYLHFKASWLIL